MPIVIHKMNASPPARAVLATAAILGIEIETREVSLPNRDNFRPEYVKKNPLHTIPLLEDGDFVLADSHAIIMYLASKYGAKAIDMYPENLMERSIVNQRLFLDASILFPKFITILREIAYDKATSVNEIKAAEVKEAYGFLETYLDESPFLAGDKLTIADVSCVTTVTSLDLLVPVGYEYLKLRGWMEKLSKETWYQNYNVPGLNDLRTFFGFRLRRI